MSRYSQSARVEKIRHKYGRGIFRRWGITGGNPVLLAQGQGLKITVHHRKAKG